MKPSTIVSTILASVVSVSAAPAENAAVSEIVTIGANTYEGSASRQFFERGLESRCGENYPPHSDCVIGQCQCSAGYGCYSCNGGRVQCQPGPGSGQCWT